MPKHGTALGNFPQLVAEVLLSVPREMDSSLAKHWGENGEALAQALMLLRTVPSPTHNERCPPPRLTRKEFAEFGQCVLRNLPRDLDEGVQGQWLQKQWVLKLALRCLASRQHYINHLPTYRVLTYGAFLGPRAIRDSIQSCGATFSTTFDKGSWPWRVLSVERFPEKRSGEAEVVLVTPEELGLSPPPSTSLVSWLEVCKRAEGFGLSKLPFEAAALLTMRPSGKKFIMGMEPILDDKGIRDVLVIIGTSWYLTRAALYENSAEGSCSSNMKIAFIRPRLISGSDS